MRIVTHKRCKLHVGDKHNRLTVIGVPFRVRFASKTRTYVVCECSCGTVLATAAQDLVANITESCGCKFREEARLRASDHSSAQRRAVFKHGECDNKIYKVWSAMKDRCENPANKAYYRYGGRGIAVCDEWHKFAVFLRWTISAGYRPGLTIDRINNDGNYEPSNCEFVTQSENMKRMFAFKRQQKCER